MNVIDILTGNVTSKNFDSEGVFLALRKHILSQFQIFMTLVLQILNVTQSETI